MPAEKNCNECNVQFNNLYRIRHLQEFEKIPAYIESLNNKERLEFIIKLLPYAVPKYTHKTISDETPELPIFDQIQIVTSVDEKERLEKVEAYEKEHNVQIL
jgi:hypothetical protein